MGKSALYLALVICGMLVLGLAGTITGQVSDLSIEPVVFLILAGLGMVGAYLEYISGNKVLKIIWAGVTGGYIGISVSSDTWFEPLFAFFFGGLLVTMGWYVFERRTPNSPTGPPHSE